MSRLSFLFLACCRTLCLFGQDDDFNLKNPGDYNNYIMKEMTATVQKNFDYISFNIHSDDYGQLESKRQDVLQQIRIATDKVRKMPPFEGETRLRDEAVDVLEEYRRAFELDYRDIIGLKRKSRDSYEMMEACFSAQDKAEIKVNAATERLRKAQQSYAGKHNLKVTNPTSDDALEIKMKKVMAVNAYWRALFLQYFRVSRHYEKMWDVLGDKKPSAIDKERRQTLEAIEEALPDVKKTPPFNGDTEFRDQTISIIEYFKKVCSERFTRVIELLEKKQLEQKDVDEINAIINQCNSDHEQLTYNWNIASQDLFRKNVDKE